MPNRLVISDVADKALEFDSDDTETLYTVEGILRTSGATAHSYRR